MRKATLIVMALAMLTASVKAQDAEGFNQIRVGMYYQDLLALCGRTDNIYSYRSADGVWCKWVYKRYPIYCEVVFINDYVANSFVGMMPSTHSM